MSKTKRLNLSCEINKPFPHCPHLAGHLLNTEDPANILTDDGKNITEERKIQQNDKKKKKKILKLQTDFA